MAAVACAVFSANWRTSSATTAKPASLLAGAGGFNGGVQRQEIGLIGHFTDTDDHLANVRHPLIQPGNPLPRSLLQARCNSPRPSAVRLAMLTPWPAMRASLVARFYTAPARSNPRHALADLLHRLGHASRRGPSGCDC